MSKIFNAKFSPDMTLAELDAIRISLSKKLPRDEWLKIKQEEYDPVYDIVAKREFEQRTGFKLD